MYNYWITVYFKTYILLLVSQITTGKTKQSKDIYQQYKYIFLDNFQISSIVFFTLYGIFQNLTIDKVWHYQISKVHILLLHMPYYSRKSTSGFFSNWFLFRLILDALSSISGIDRKQKYFTRDLFNLFFHI